MKFKSNNKQGDWGMGEAIQYYTSLGMTVCIPLTDSQPYDLVVEHEDGLKKIQVKTTLYKRKYPMVRLSQTGRMTKKGRSVIPFDYKTVDYIFVVTKNSRYLIPSVEGRAKYAFNLSEKYDEFKI